MGWEDIRCATVGGGAETTRFIWAHERAEFRAYPISNTNKHSQHWICDVITGTQRAASFTINFEAVPKKL